MGLLDGCRPLYRALREIRPDVIYQRVACGYTGIAAYYARRHAARFIWHVSSDTDVISQRLRDEPNPVRRYLEKRSVEYGIRHASQIVVQTETQGRLLRQNYGRTADAVIPNFHPQPRETIDKRDPVSVVWIANLKPLKRPEIFVRMAAALQDLQGVRFVMIGAPPASGRRGQVWFEGLLRTIKATPNIEYLGEKSLAKLTNCWQEPTFS